MGKKHLLIWAVCCLLITAAGIAYPVTSARSLGLEGANQANMVSRTEELTAGRVLEFVLEPPADTAEEIGFSFHPEGISLRRDISGSWHLTETLSSEGGIFSCQR